MLSPPWPLRFDRQARIFPAFVQVSLFTSSFEEETQYRRKGTGHGEIYRRRSYTARNQGVIAKGGSALGQAVRRCERCSVGRSRALLRFGEGDATSSSIAHTTFRLLQWAWRELDRPGENKDHRLLTPDGDRRRGQDQSATGPGRSAQGHHSTKAAITRNSRGNREPTLAIGARGLGSTHRARSRGPRLRVTHPCIRATRGARVANLATERDVSARRAARGLGRRVLHSRSRTTAALRAIARLRAHGRLLRSAVCRSIAVSSTPRCMRAGSTYTPGRMPISREIATQELSQRPHRRLRSTRTPLPSLSYPYV